MDVVYTCRNGSNEELRYSLRSLVNVPHDRVWIFGGWPAWVNNVTIVATPQKAPKYDVTFNSTREACLNPEVSDPFWLWNDDFYAIAPTSPEHYHRGPVRDVLSIYEEKFPTGTYALGMRNTLEVLEANGCQDPLSYELHVPLVVHKAPMLEAIRMGDGHLRWNKRTAYGAIAGIGGEYMADVKVYDSTTLNHEGPWLSSCDRTYQAVYRGLKTLFPEPGIHER